MRTNIFLTNVDYITDPVSELPIIRLYGKTEHGESLVFYEENFKPYFYLANPSSHDRRLLGMAGAILGESVELEHYQEKYDCVKVELRHPKYMPKLREKLISRGRTVFSGDILYQLRYLYDKDLGAFVEVEHNQHDEILSIKRCSPFEVNLDVLTFDIECSLRTKEMYCIGAQINDNPGVVFTNAGGEAKMIEDFVDFIQDVDPDIITGYNSNGFDIPKIMEKCRSLNVDFGIGRAGDEPWMRDDNKRRMKAWYVSGRIFVDTWQQVRQELQPIQESLGFVGELLGVGSKDNVDASRIEEEWKNRRLAVIKYCKQDVNVTYEVFMHEKVASIPKAMALSVASDLPLEHSFAPATSRIVDSLLIRRFDKLGFAVPQNNWNNKAKKIKGATVFEVFEPGIYENVGIFDFKSMYPSVMIGNNICPTTFTKTETNDSVRSPLGVYFRLDKESIVPKILKDLWSWRDETKLKVEKNGDYFDRLQYSIKVLMNSFYGVMASDFYRFTNPSIGGSITAFARLGIQNVYEELGARKYTVIYGDTDSVFVQLKDDRDPHKLAEELSARGLEMELEKILETFFTHGAKKRYAAKVEWPKKEFYVKGYELKRGDSFKIQREILEKSLRLILDKKPDDALKLVTETVKTIKNTEVDLEDLLITKSVKSPKDYVNPDSNAGVQAAMKLQARGYPWLPGTKISWVVSNSKTTPMEVEPYVETAELSAKFDRDYYADRIVKTMSDIAGVFGWDDMGLRSNTKQLKLF